METPNVEIRMRNAEFDSSFSIPHSSLDGIVDIKLDFANIVTHILSLSVFPNVIVFLIFNRFDMLRASRGVLAATIVWAVIVFGIKFFG